MTEDASKAIDWLIEVCLPDKDRILAFGRQPGAARVRVHSDVAGAPPWQPAPSAADLQAGIITITLLSDAIVPDRWLGFERTLSAEWLANALGLDAVKEVVPENHFSSMRAIHGWNGAYSRLRETDLAIAAGSAFCYLVEWQPELRLEECVTRVAAVQERGVGLRRSEGFGEILFNSAFHACFKRSDEEPA